VAAVGYFPLEAKAGPSGNRDLALVPAPGGEDS
jgi:hypothetical protein